MENRLSFVVVSRQGRQPMQLKVRALWNGGWSGRDQAAVRRHAEELSSHGVPPPTTVPIYFPLTNNLATTSDAIQVVGPETSGEIEFAILFADDGGTYVSVASDHTDRAAERYGIQLSKQLYPDVVAGEVWPLDEVREQWDQLVLRCFAWTSGSRALYQEAPLADLLSADAWLAILERERLDEPGLVFLSGTPPTLGGLVFADAYDLELEDPLLDRTIHHHYRVELLPPGH
jgi:hypothetical protein